MRLARGEMKLVALTRTDSRSQGSWPLRSGSVEVVGLRCSDGDLGCHVELLPPEGELGWRLRLLGQQGQGSGDVILRVAAEDGTLGELRIPVQLTANVAELEQSNQTLREQLAAAQAASRPILDGFGWQELM